MRSTIFPFDGNCSEITWSPGRNAIAVRDNGQSTFFIYQVEKKMRLPWMLFPQQDQKALLCDIACLAWSPTGTSLAVGSDTRVMLVDPFRGFLLEQLRLPRRCGGSQSVSWSPIEKRLALTTHYQQGLLFDVPRRKPMQNPQEISLSETPTHSAAYVHGWLQRGGNRWLPLFSNAQMLLTVDDDQNVCQLPRETFAIDPQSCAVSPSGRSVALASDIPAQVTLLVPARRVKGSEILRKTKIYQPEEPYWSDHPKNMYSHSTKPSLVAWSRDEQYVATSFGSVPNRIYIWDATTGRTIHILEGGNQKVMSLSWGPDCQLSWGGEGYFQIGQFL